MFITATCAFRSKIIHQHLFFKSYHAWLNLKNNHLSTKKYWKNKPSLFNWWSWTLYFFSTCWIGLIAIERYKLKGWWSTSKPVTTRPNQNTVYRVTESSNAHQVPSEVMSLESNHSRQIRQAWKRAIKSLTFATVFLPINWKCKVHSLLWVMKTRHLVHYAWMTSQGVKPKSKFF